jgi:hypothetical protein
VFRRREESERVEVLLDLDEVFGSLGADGRFGWRVTATETVDEPLGVRSVFSITAFAENAQVVVRKD